ncbi:hypothetical protein E2C01_075109 [Portunus trituberculatus]|uniref:Uncharacterized protein n=1 Tax=Portunus trituberculatus TaxID=210409 RepID=A0A5B7IFB3_PORTR|nr:hypothetical protein [Portunus trituberculatus]
MKQSCRHVLHLCVTSLTSHRATGTSGRNATENLVDHLSVAFENVISLGESRTFLNKGLGVVLTEALTEELEWQ